MQSQQPLPMQHQRQMLLTQMLYLIQTAVKLLSQLLTRLMPTKQKLMQSQQPLPMQHQRQMLLTQMLYLIQTAVKLLSQLLTRLMPTKQKLMQSQQPLPMQHQKLAMHIQTLFQQLLLTHLQKLLQLTATLYHIQTVLLLIRSH